ncbi:MULTISPECIES: TonB-dependent receptor [unclassified Acinetobacter]|uniref:TonB-dependent receptor n=1 Tax=unclassified Acinetobacter TaxID=196816 RepID=UPI00190AA42E|nr:MULTISPECIES: TonB-dependent siderophore receptor [unclassified Acinetobacter]MBK0065082.1 TonB-dependent siderophore receptor [Acinetobacter sp. S55]MBK0068204.1 TonB-dependent siderophore receptor [Acinetobacter sp. S54]
MNINIHFKKAILSISIALLLSHNVIAGENTQSAQQLPTIIVKAEATDNTTLSNGQVSKKSQLGILGNKDALDTPFSITSYTAKYIEDQQATSIAKTLKNEPSVRSVFSGNGLGEYFNIRGFYTQSHEMAWNGLFGLVPHNRIPTEFLERVEVFRGTSALLNGMSLGGAVGGVINVVPKRAGQQDITRVTTTYTSDSNLGLHLDVGRRFGDEKQFGVRVNALKSGGDTALDGQEEDRTLGSIALDYKGDKLRASLDLYDINEKVDGGMPLMVSFASADIPKAPDSKINTQPGSYAHTKATGVIANVQYDFLDDWTAYTTVGTKDQKSHGVIANNALGMAAKPNGDYTAISRMNANDTDVNAAEAGVRGKFTTGQIKHELVLSGNRIDQNTYMGLSVGTPWQSNIYNPKSGTNAARPANVPKISETKLSSVAFADTLSVLQDKYQLILGLREQRVESQSFSINPATNALNPAYKESALTPAIGIVLKPWGNHLSLYANYMEGLSQGDTVSDTTAANVGTVFKPYKSKQFEIGTKWDLGNFRNTLSFYQITKPSLIKNTTTNIYSDDGEQRNRGVEWTTAGELVDHLRLLGGISYLDAKYTKTAGGVYQNNDVMGIPHWQSNLGVEWDVPLQPNLTLSANSVYTGSMYADNANTQKLPDWVVFDLGARYATVIARRNVVFRGGIDNIFDKKHWAGVWNGYVGVGGDPRAYKLSMQIDF